MNKFTFNTGNLPINRSGLYCVTNLKNGTVYIGISHNLKRRAYEHATQNESALGNAVRKHGCVNFLFEPLLYSIDPSDTSFLPLLEAEKIAEHDSVKNGYNITEASGRVGPYGESFASKIRAAHARKTPAERSAIVRKAKANMSEEHKSEVGRNNALAIGRDVLSARMRATRRGQSKDRKSEIAAMGGKASIANKTLDQMREAGHKMIDTYMRNTTPEQRLKRFLETNPIIKLSKAQLSENGRKGAQTLNSSRTPEQRSEAARHAALAMHKKRADIKRASEESLK